MYSGRIPFVFRTITGLIQASRRCLAGCSPCGGLLHFVRTAGYIKARARLVGLEGASTPYTRWLPRRVRLQKDTKQPKKSKKSRAKTPPEDVPRGPPQNLVHFNSQEETPINEGHLDDPADTLAPAGGVDAVGDTAEDRKVRATLRPGSKGFLQFVVCFSMWGVSLATISWYIAGGILRKFWKEVGSSFISSTMSLS